MLSILCVTQNPMVTAGLKCPPDICPKADAISAIARPWANAIAMRLPVMMIDATPTNTSVKAPMDSASRRGTSVVCGNRLSSEYFVFTVVVWKYLGERVKCQAAYTVEQLGLHNCLDLLSYDLRCARVGY